MTHTEESAPVFVDATGRRRRQVRRIAYAVGAACLTYTGLVGASVLGDPVRPSALAPFPTPAKSPDPVIRLPQNPDERPPPPETSREGSGPILVALPVRRSREAPEERTAPAPARPTPRTESTPAPAASPKPTESPKPTGPAESPEPTEPPEPTDPPEPMPTQEPEPTDPPEPTPAPADTPRVAPPDGPVPIIGGILDLLTAE